MNHTNCICDSGIKASICCEKYLSGAENASTPKKLMRSRYTAYARVLPDYIMRTMKAPAANHFSAAQMRAAALTMTWTGLAVLDASTHGNSGYVEFIAYYTSNGQAYQLHEKSTFRRDDGIWYYIDGILI